MNLFILAHNLRVGGGWVVGRNIVRTLQDLVPQHRVTVVVPAGHEYPRGPRHSDWSTLEVGTRLRDRLDFELRQLPRLVHQLRPDWVWGLGNVALPSVPGRQALLIHDPHLVYPSRHYGREHWKYRAGIHQRRWQLRRALPALDVVFCQTDVMRRRFAETFGAGPTLRLLPNAVSSEFTPQPRPPRHRDSPFTCLTLSRYYAHKNLERIVEAYRRYPDVLRGTRCVLTVRPDHHPHAPALLRSIQRFGLQHVLHNRGPIHPRDLGATYADADALLLPSLLESYSGTYQEAMSMRTPILTSDLDFAREVCGDAALYFDPWSARDLAHSIARLRDRPDLALQLARTGAQRKQSMFCNWQDIVASALDDLGIEHADP